MTRQRRMFVDDTFAAVRSLPKSDGLFIDQETLSVDDERSLEKARAVDRRLPAFGRDYPVIGVVRVSLRISTYADEDMLKERAREARK